MKNLGLLLAGLFVVGSAYASDEQDIGVIRLVRQDVSTVYSDDINQIPVVLVGANEDIDDQLSNLTADTAYRCTVKYSRNGFAAGGKRLATVYSLRNCEVLKNQARKQ
jgi:hypothetical protein